MEPIINDISGLAADIFPVCSHLSGGVAGSP